jgi:hypothetical protein
VGDLLNRRLNAPDGSFAGIVSATIPVECLRQTLSRFNLGPNGRDDDRRDLDGGLLSAIRRKLRGQSVEVGNRKVSKELATSRRPGCRAAPPYRTVTR